MAIGIWISNVFLFLFCFLSNPVQTQTQINWFSQIQPNLDNGFFFLPSPVSIQPNPDNGFLFSYPILSWFSQTQATIFFFPNPVSIQPNPDNDFFSYPILSWFSHTQATISFLPNPVSIQPNPDNDFFFPYPILSWFSQTLATIFSYPILSRFSQTQTTVFFLPNPVSIQPNTDNGCCFFFLFLTQSCPDSGKPRQTFFYMFFFTHSCLDSAKPRQRHFSYPIPSWFSQTQVTTVKEPSTPADGGSKVDDKKQLGPPPVIAVAYSVVVEPGRVLIVSASTHCENPRLLATKRFVLVGRASLMFGAQTYSFPLHTFCCCCCCSSNGSLSFVQMQFKQ